MFKKSLLILAFISFSSIRVFSQNQSKFEDIAKKEFLMENSPREESNSIKNDRGEILDAQKSTDLKHHLPKDYKPNNDYFFEESIESASKPSLESKNYDIDNTYVPTNSESYVVNDTLKSKKSDYSTTLLNPKRILLIILIILILFVILKSYKNRDKSDDYKISPIYKNLSNEDRLRADLVHGLSKKIQSVINPAESKFNNKLLITGVIADRKISLLGNKINIANQYGLTINSTAEIIEECCLGAYVSYMEE